MSAATRRAPAFMVLAWFAVCFGLMVVLSGCAGAPIDACKYAALRRATYTTAITAADVYAASGRPVPQEMTLGRQAAVIALTMLDARCPRKDS